MNPNKSILIALALSAAPAAAQSWAQSGAPSWSSTAPSSPATGNQALSEFALELSASGNTATFTFRNTTSAIITEIWFEDTILGLSSGFISDAHSGVDFTADADASTARGFDWGGALSKFERTKAGGVNNGINAGEHISITFAADSDFAQYGLQSLLSGDSRIGLRLQGRTNGDAYITTLPTISTVIIPLPSAAGLAGLSLGVLAVAARRRR